MGTNTSTQSHFYTHWSTANGRSGYLRNTSARSSQLVKSKLIYREPNENGWRDPTDYSASGFKCILSNIEYEMDLPRNYTGDRIAISSTLGTAQVLSSVQTPPAGTMDRIRAKAIVRARNALADRRANFSESLVEARSTVQGLANNAKTIARFADAWYRCNTADMSRALGLSRSAGRRAARATVNKGWGSAWLNYWFGLSPIVDDMVSGLAFLSDEDVHNNFRVHGRGRAEEPGSRSYTFDQRSVYSKIQWAYKDTTRFRAQCNVWAKPTAPAFRKLAAYGFLDVEATLWAVAPYSFLVDWVLPVSTVLKSHSALRGLEYLGGDVSTTIRTKRDITKVTPVPEPNCTLLQSMARPGKSEAFSFKRVAYLKNPPSSYRLWIKDPFDTWKAVTALALLGEALDKPLRKFKFITK